LSTTLVLVGGGHAHLSVLKLLAKHCPPKLTTILISPSNFQNYSGMLPGWIAGHYTQDQCRIDLVPLAKAANVALIIGSAVDLDAPLRRVKLKSGQEIKYDLLSLDIGSETNISWLKDLGQKLLPLKPLDDFYSSWPSVLRDARENPGYMLAVVGGGAAGVETALAAQEAFIRNNISGSVELVASDVGILPGHSKSVQKLVENFARKAGLNIHFTRGIGSVNGILLADGRHINADRVIAATSAKAANWLGNTKLKLDKDGYVMVDKFHRSVSHPNVFAVGDVCSRLDAEIHKSGVHAVRVGPILAQNLLTLATEGDLQPYKPKRKSLYLLACGPHFAVMSWGRWSAAGAWVWHIKDWIDNRFIRSFSGNSRVK
jgi:pyridine nucleotide-disulfide oxidoreductase family protein